MICKYFCPLRSLLLPLGALFLIPLFTQVHAIMGGVYYKDDGWPSFAECSGTSLMKPAKKRGVGQHIVFPIGVWAARAV